MKVSDLESSSENKPKNTEKKDPLGFVAANLLRYGRHDELLNVGTESHEQVSSQTSGNRHFVSPFNAFSSSFCVWWFALGAIITGVLVFSVQPVMRLKPNPPPEFLAVHPPVDISAQLFARAYWSCARNLPYSYGVALPPDPPPQFSVPEEQWLPHEAASEIRYLYWRQLQMTWLAPSAWETTYSWKWISLGMEMFHALVHAARDWLRV